mmetsp:Transcript_16628/g.27748  ORF Transcript_16628/g.27748 Transcript_16628/m.27748 type:complete len:339 (-) Transcript_16628:396-1412(-)
MWEGCWSFRVAAIPASSFRPGGRASRLKSRQQILIPVVIIQVHIQVNGQVNSQVSCLIRGKVAKTLQVAAQVTSDGLAQRHSSGLLPHLVVHLGSLPKTSLVHLLVEFAAVLARRPPLLAATAVYVHVHGRRGREQPSHRGGYRRHLRGGKLLLQLLMRVSRRRPVCNTLSRTSSERLGLLEPAVAPGGDGGGLREGEGGVRVRGRVELGGAAGDVREAGNVGHGVVRDVHLAQQLHFAAEIHLRVRNRALRQWIPRCQRQGGLRGRVQELRDVKLHHAQSIIGGAAQLGLLLLANHNLTLLFLVPLQGAFCLSVRRDHQRQRLLHSQLQKILPTSSI